MKRIGSSAKMQKALQESPTINDSGNPEEVCKFFTSDTQFGDVNCAFIFSQNYHLNICINFEYGAGTAYYRCRSNEDEDFLHLHLRNAHFSPYMSGTLDEVVKPHSDRYAIEGFNTSNSNKDERY